MTPATGRTAEGFPENVFEPASAGAAATARGTGKAFRTEAESLEFRLGREAARAASAAAPKSLVAVETRLTLGVDLAAVEGFALIFLAENFVRGIELGKARGGLRVVLVGVRVQLLRLAPEGALDLGLTRLAIDAQHLIGVAHSP